MEQEVFLTNEHQSKSILITGTSTGIGKATALYLDQQGYRVFATVRKEKDGQELREQASPLLSPILLDVRDEASLSSSEGLIRQQVGEAGLWGLVNNAATSFALPLESVPLEELRQLFEVNVFGTLSLTQKLLPLIRKAQGRIVNISSIAASVVAPFHGPYSASKLALNGLNDALRLELRPLGVRVSLVLYGSVRTPIWNTGGELSRDIVQAHPAPAWDLYRENYQSLIEYFRKLGKAGISTQEAIHPIVHALTTDRPKTRYYVGRNARLLAFMSRFFEGDLRDWMLMRMIGLSDSQVMSSEVH